MSTVLFYLMSVFAVLPLRVVVLTTQTFCSRSCVMLLKFWKWALEKFDQ